MAGIIAERYVNDGDNEALGDWFRGQKCNTMHQEYDVIYVNYDNIVQNFRHGDQTWEVRFIEEDFHRLTFDVEDV